MQKSLRSADSDRVDALFLPPLGLLRYRGLEPRERSIQRGKILNIQIADFQRVVFNVLPAWFGFFAH